MQVMTCAFLSFILLAAAQEKDHWQRIYSFDDATVDLNTSSVIFGPDFTGRVQFRISLSKPEPAPGNKGARYKSVIQTIEFRCPERLYRVVEVKRFDGKGNQIDSTETKPAEEWNGVKSGSLMSRLLTHGCELIYEKKKNP
jgi:hypothetical protein